MVFGTEWYLGQNGPGIWDRMATRRYMGTMVLFTSQRSWTILYCPVFYHRKGKGVNREIDKVLIETLANWP
jgi:hypothetical protein